MRGLAVAAVAAVALPIAGRVAGGTAGVHVAAFQPTRESVRVFRAASPQGTEFSSIVSARRARLTVNGTYYGKDGLPLGLLRSNGRWLFRGGRLKTVFAVDRQGVPSIVQREEVRRNPSRYPFAVGAGPRLLTGGRVTLNPEAEGFRPASRRLRASRAALGVRADGTALIIVDELPVTLSEFAGVCRSAGAVDAVNLDGGGATGFAEGGRVVVMPRIPMINAITVGER